MNLQKVQFSLQKFDYVHIDFSSRLQLLFRKGKLSVCACRHVCLILILKAENMF